MKLTLRILFLLFNSPLLLKAQITTPVIKARFGVDADVRANFFNNLVQAGNDDWFNLIAADTSGCISCLSFSELIFHSIK